jgi:hypothetical protein
MPSVVQIHVPPPVAHVAQSAERVLGKDKVTGSTPVVGSSISCE